MKDPLDNRPDAYLLLNCTENCARADAQRNYTAQLVRRAAPQRDLQRARELLVRSEQRLLYDIFRYNFTLEAAGTEALKAPELDIEVTLPLEPLRLCRDWIDVIGLLEQIPLRWTAPEPPALCSLPVDGDTLVQKTPIEFDC
jgi:hypothetical protein